MAIDTNIKPLVSICCMTYNHENYIRQCLNGFVMQKTSFPFEILVHEDASTDSTANIVKEYEMKYPHLFRCVYQTENQFAKQNTLLNILFPMSGGKYIALCEGDDYWTDPYKLQKQVDFLELNQNFSASAHQSLVKYESGEKEFHNFKNPPSEILYTKDLLYGRFFHTASFVFRSSCIKNIHFPTKIAAGDRALFLLCSFSGPIKYFPEPLCVYRKNNTGLSHTITYKQIKGDTRIAKWLKGFRPDFPVHKFQMHIHQSIINYSKAIPLYAILWHYIGFLYHASFNLEQNYLEIKKFSIRHLLKKEIYGICRRIFHPR